jgi:RNA polymerase sigma factor (sigma-70 family)
MFVCDCPPDDCAAKVQRYLSGDRAAGDELATKFGGLVRRIVQRVLGPGRREEWDDAAQAIFLRVFANLHRWEHRCPFCKWLPVVAGRRAIDFTRMPSPMEPLPDGEVADRRPQSVPTELLEQIERTLARFPEEWRAVWGLWLQGKHRDEIAREAGRSVRTVHYWLAEMLDQLRESMGD